MHPYTADDAAAEGTSDAASLVDDILRSIENTDAGNEMSDEDKVNVDAMIAQLEKVGEAQEPQPLENPEVGRCKL